jgi:phosphotransferase system HPr (HPr) family protein
VDEIRRTYKIVNRLGLHARPASQVVKVASEFRAKLFVEKGGQRARATSILELLLLCGQPGTELTLVATGADAEHAVAAVGQLIGNRFGETE